jgi:hypothetical protein
LRELFSIYPTLDVKFTAINMAQSKQSSGGGKICGTFQNGFDEWVSPNVGFIMVVGGSTQSGKDFDPASP